MVEVYDEVALAEQVRLGWDFDDWADGVDSVTLAEDLYLLVDLNPTVNDTVTVAENLSVTFPDYFYTHSLHPPSLPFWSITAEFNRYVWDLDERLPFWTVSAAFGWGVDERLPFWEISGELTQDSYPVTVAGVVPNWTLAAAFGWELSQEVPLWSSLTAVMNTDGFMTLSERAPCWSLDADFYEREIYSLEETVAPWKLVDDQENIGSIVAVDSFTLAETASLWTAVMEMYVEGYFTLAKDIPLWDFSDSEMSWSVFSLAESVPVWAMGGEGGSLDTSGGIITDEGEDFDDYLLIYRRP